jgi:molybdopterin-containing oxidoreductase family membrane subunit
MAAVFSVCILINVGMWFERFVIIVTSLHRDYLPANWATYAPTSIELATLAGSFGIFFTAFLLFTRFIPVIAMSEVKGVLHVRRPVADVDNIDVKAVPLEAGEKGDDS